MSSADEFDLDLSGITGKILEAERELVDIGHFIPPTTTAELANGETRLGLAEVAYGHSSKKTGTNFLYFDIETIPDYDRLDSFGFEPLPEVPAVTPANLCPPFGPLDKRTEKEVQEIISKPGVLWPGTLLDELVAEEKRGKGRKGIVKLFEAARHALDDIKEQHEDRLKLLSTTPEYCKICSLAMADGNNPVASRVIGLGYTEAELLELFWANVGDGCTLVCYNGIYFDLPVIFYRSAMLGIEPTRQISLSKYSNRDVLDLFVRRFPNGNASPGRPGKLKQLARLAGLSIPAGDMEGSQVDHLMKTNPKLVGEYCASDVAILRAYHLKFKDLFW